MGFNLKNLVTVVFLVAVLVAVSGCTSSTNMTNNSTNNTNNVVVNNAPSTIQLIISVLQRPRKKLNSTLQWE